jgi:hypothetical protein
VVSDMPWVLVLRYTIECEFKAVLLCHSALWAHHNDVVKAGINCGYVSSPQCCVLIRKLELEEID